LIHASDIPADRRELLQQCAQLASQCSNEIRTASYLLHPPLLDELGLMSALRWLADGFHERSGIEVRLDLPNSMPRLSRDEELTLFRVAQEALSNVHRHAQSPWAAVRLREREDAVVLEIEDGGLGGRAPGASSGSFALGVGLSGMRERIRQVGGTFTVRAGDSGTIVQVTLPRKPS
jgi:signal transduction histidine kinase